MTIKSRTILHRFQLNNREYIIRRFDEKNDSIEELTGLLHRAYKRLADMGLNFVATHQDEDYTKRYLKKGECYVLTDKNNSLIGTIPSRAKPPMVSSGDSPARLVA
jgi:hypothetical protein